MTRKKFLGRARIEPWRPEWSPGAQIFLFWEPLSPIPYPKKQLVRSPPFTLSCFCYRSCGLASGSLMIPPKRATKDFSGVTQQMSRSCFPLNISLNRCCPLRASRLAPPEQLLSEISRLLFLTSEFDICVTFRFYTISCS